MNDEEPGELMLEEHTREERKFTFKECCQLLKINPKSFVEWLKKAQIDPERQRDKFDPRKKYLYTSQLVKIAADHDRALPPLDTDEREVENTPAMSVEMLAEQLAAWCTEMTQRFDQVDHAVLQLSPLLEGIAQTLREIQKTGLDAPAWRHLAQRFDQVEQGVQTSAAPSEAARQEQDASETEPSQKPAKVSTPVRHEGTSATHEATSSGRSKTRSKKKPVRGKKLPRHLIALRDFAKLHTIEMERASQAGKSGKIAVVRGEWLVNSRWATEALAVQGQHDFYETFHTHKDFTPCEQCPHVLLAS